MDLDWQFWTGLGLGFGGALVFLYRAALRTLIEMANAEKAQAQQRAIRERMQAPLHVPPEQDALSLAEAIRDAQAARGRKPKFMVVR